MGVTTRKTLKEVKQEIKKLNPNLHIKGGYYINSKAKTLIVYHKLKNGEIHEYTTSRFLILHSKGKCPICHNEKLKSGKYIKSNSRKTIEQFKQEVFNKYNGEYEVLDNEYKNNKTKMTFKHLDHTFQMTPNDFLFGHKCPVCRGYQYNADLFNKKLEEIYGKNKFKLVGNYIDRPTRILNNKGKDYIEIECCKCKTKFKRDYSFLLNGTTSCPNCNKDRKSYEERIINEILSEYNIDYISEYSFDDCKYKRKLKFDFVIFYKNKVVCIIEFDGAFHYENKYKYYKESYEKQKIRDEIKNNYCLNNNIPLLRIPYKKEYYKSYSKEELKIIIFDFIFKNSKIIIKPLNK